MAFERLEPDEVKVSSPVLRGERGREALDLPGSFSTRFLSILRQFFLLNTVFTLCLTNSTRIQSKNVGDLLRAMLFSMLSITSGN